jgi:hypothetical protein
MLILRPMTTAWRAGDEDWQSASKAERTENRCTR